MKLDLTLYMITSSDGFSEDEILAQVESGLKGGVTLVQLREKTLDTREYINRAGRLKQITDKFDVPLIIDDRVDVALAVDAGGVHLGACDMPISIARRILGKNKIIGATAKTVEQAKIAQIEGANYLGVGAIFPTTTKVITVPTSVETLNNIIKTTRLPTVAIGGINLENIGTLYNSQASGVAVVSALMKSENPCDYAAKLKSAIIKNFPKFWVD